MGEHIREKKKGCLKSHYGLLSKFSVIIILMDLISLQFAVAMMFSVSCHMLQRKSLSSFESQ